MKKAFLIGLLVFLILASGCTSSKKSESADSAQYKQCSDGTKVGTAEECPDENSAAIEKVKALLKASETSPTDLDNKNKWGAFDDVTVKNPCVEGSGSDCKIFNPLATADNEEEILISWDESNTCVRKEEQSCEPLEIELIEDKGRIIVFDGLAIWLVVDEKIFSINGVAMTYTPSIKTVYNIEFNKYLS